MLLPRLDTTTHTCTSFSDRASENAKKSKTMMKTKVLSALLALMVTLSPAVGATGEVRQPISTSSTPDTQSPSPDAPELVKTVPMIWSKVIRVATSRGACEAIRDALNRNKELPPVKCKKLGKVWVVIPK